RTLVLDGGRSLAIMLSLNSLEYFMAIIDVSPCPYINTQINKNRGDIFSNTGGYLQVGNADIGGR
ncbi:MAG: hypothetical protein ABIJ50_14985, partial [Pseudomonadota bacterium]